MHNIAGAGFSGVYGGGSYPGYVGTPGQLPALPYSPAADVPAPGFYSPYGSTHSTDMSPFGVSPGISGSGSGFHVGTITPAPGVGYPPGGAPPAYGGSVPPIGGPGIGVSSIAPYPSPFGGAVYPGLDNRPFNVKCDEGEGFKQVSLISFFLLNGSQWQI